MITKLKKAELLQIVKENRSTHRKVFEDALEGYRVASIKELGEALERAKSGTPQRFISSLPVPQDQTNVYDRAIRMLELDTSDIVELDEDQFGSLVLDQWHWTKDFAASNKSYVSGANLAYISRLEDS